MGLDLGFGRGKRYLGLACTLDWGEGEPKKVPIDCWIGEREVTYWLRD